MNNNFQEYPEITTEELEIAIHRRNFVEIPKKQNVNLMLDSDIFYLNPVHPETHSFKKGDDYDCQSFND